METLVTETNEAQADAPKPRVSGWTRRQMKLRARLFQAETRAQVAENRVRELEKKIRGESL